MPVLRRTYFYSAVLSVTTIGEHSSRTAIISGGGKKTRTIVVESYCIAKDAPAFIR